MRGPTALPSSPAAPMDRHQPEYSRPYCLHCYAPIAPSSSPSVWCGTCGRSNLKVDLDRLWTGERRFRDLEDMLKVAVVLGMLAFCAYAVFVLGLQDYRAMPMAIFVPGVVGVLLWDLASITHRSGVYRWDVISAVLGWLVCPLWLLVTGARVLRARELEHRLAFLGLFLAGLLVAVLSIGAPWLRARLRAWRDGHVAARQAALRDAPLD